MLVTLHCHEEAYDVTRMVSPTGTDEDYGHETTIMVMKQQSIVLYNSLPLLNCFCRFLNFLFIPALF